ncbi:MAG TPA: hypothetical protein VGG85_11630 [Terracidiphilus sp.]|jgi:hypothetical protein
MDEEDGRPGALAAQTGHLDAQSGVPTLSLRLAQPIPFDPTDVLVQIFEPEGDFLSRVPHDQTRMEIHHENVPGK